MDQKVNPTYQLPAKAYFDQDWFEQEKLKIFGASWLFAGFETELQNADLQHADFIWADLRDANIDGAILNNTDFREVENLPISLEEAKARSAEVE